MSWATFSFEAGDGHDDFEGGAGGQLRLDGLVQQRMVGVVEDLVPVALADADGELVGVEGGAGGQGEDLAGVGIHRDDGSGLAFEGLLGGHLDVEVDGELEVLCRRRRAPGRAGRSPCRGS